MLRRNLLVLAAGSLLLAPGCASPVARAYRSHLPGAPGAPTGASNSNPAITITGAGYDVHAAGEVGQAVLDRAWAGVLATLNRYLEAGVLTPLGSGGPAGDLAPHFTAGAGARVTSPGPDRAAFIDEGLPPATVIRGGTAVATLAGLAGPDGVMSVVTARLDLRIRAEVGGTAVTIARAGELVLVPEGGTWRIDAYDIRVSRDSAEARTTTTARSS